MKNKILTSLDFSGKSQVLKDLSRHLKSALILPMIDFTVSEVVRDSAAMVTRISREFGQQSVIIRSSAASEDLSELSNAGHYASVSGVSAADAPELTIAIKKVIDSFDDAHPENRIFVQPILTDIRLAGVIFTADLDSLAPYYIINYDESGKADAITGGRGGHFRTYVQFRDYEDKDDDPRFSLFRRIISVCCEIERLFNNRFLDIEFAVDKKSQIYIFQCRPISIQNKENLSTLSLRPVLLKIRDRLAAHIGSSPNLLGEKTLFGVMPDWNPAEIIGVKPKRLSLSLYKELFTDAIWAYQRDNYGYRNLRSHPLLVSLAGIPYIDVRVDFNSFIPKNLNDQIAGKLANHYLNQLSLHPAHHDKVEFEIIHSCYYLDLPLRLKELIRYGFNENEIKRIEYALLELTNSIIDPTFGHFKNDLDKIQKLKHRYDLIVHSHLSMIDKIYWLIEDCKRYGTLPFAGIARAAFIATQFLKSFVTLNIISQDDFDFFMNSLDTVTKRLHRDLHGLSKKTLTEEEFLSTYGHLRPGTYDISSYRYDEYFTNYFTPAESIEFKSMPFAFSERQIGDIDMALIENGIKSDAVGLLHFIKSAIEGREYAKFIFSKSLSRVLSLVQELGRESGIDREDLAFLDIKQLLDAYSTVFPGPEKDTLLSEIHRHKDAYQFTKAIRLPTLITEPDDVFRFFIDCEEPNFITLKTVEATILNEELFATADFGRKIVLIRSADPGYDFLFTKNIAGLVTQYGGANSHMAVRCSELGIPAVIGAGEINFEAWKKARLLKLDCANKKVTVIS